MTTRSLVRARAFLLASLLLFANTAHATPSLRYSWGDCDPLVLDQEFTGPGRYVQTLSVTGLTQPLTHFQVDVVIGPGRPDAWEFFDFSCQGSSRLTVATTAASCDSVPGLAITEFLIVNPADGRRQLRIFGTAPAGPAPDPSARHVLARLDFDHSASVAGLSAPGQCGGADLPQCFGIEFATLNAGAVNPVLENGTLTWNVPSTPGVCPFRVPTHASTWGRLKAIYR